MRVTEKDTEDRRFWFCQKRAEEFIHAALGKGFIEMMNDHEAKAVSDAVEALTKAKLIAARRERTEIG